MSDQPVSQSAPPERISPLRGRMIRDGDTPASNANIANIITVVRIFLAPLFIWLLLLDDGEMGLIRYLAAALFIFAIVTDTVDGHLARGRNLITNVGIILDPIADKVLTGGALVALSILGELPWWITIVILVREFGITIYRFAFDILGAPTSVVAVATKTVTDVDRQTSMILSYGDEAQAVLQTTLDLRGPTRAVIVGSEGRIEIDETWYAPTTYTRFDADGNVVEEFDGSVTGRGMQFQAEEIERLVAAGELANDILSPSGSVEIMHTLDEIRRQIGLTYPMLDEN